MKAFILQMCAGVVSCTLVLLAGNLQAGRAGEAPKQPTAAHRQADPRLSLDQLRQAYAANPYDPYYARYFASRRPWGRHTCYDLGKAQTPQATPHSRVVAHWLQFAAACSPN